MNAATGTVLTREVEKVDLLVVLQHPINVRLRGQRMGDDPTIRPRLRVPHKQDREPEQINEGVVGRIIHGRPDEQCRPPSSSGEPIGREDMTSAESFQQLKPPRHRRTNVGKQTCARAEFNVMPIGVDADDPLRHQCRLGRPDGPAGVAHGRCARVHELRGIGTRHGGCGWGGGWHAGGCGGCGGCGWGGGWHAGCGACGGGGRCVSTAPPTTTPAAPDSPGRTRVGVDVATQAEPQPSWGRRFVPAQKPPPDYPGGSQ